MEIYKFCPRCKNPLTFNKNCFLCGNCGQKIYKDPKPCVNALPIRDGKILLGVRAVNPFKGEYDIIGGFMETGESAEDALRREVKEETGLEIRVIKLLGTYPDKYGKGGSDIICFQFIVEIVGGKPKANDDISGLMWFPIESLPKINSFKNVRDTLKDLQKWYKKTSRGAGN